MISFDMIFPVDCLLPFTKLQKISYTAVPTLSRVCIVQACEWPAQITVNFHFPTLMDVIKMKIEEIGNFHAI